MEKQTIVKLDAIITSLIDSLRTGMEKTDGNVPLAALTPVTAAIANLASARKDLAGQAVSMPTRVKC